MFNSLNFANIAMIRKSKAQLTWNNYDLLVNVIFTSKIIARILANRLKLILNKIISQNHSALY
jgi:hypothetical protein